jgi:rhodanese-related sulfurtransferase
MKKQINLLLLLIGLISCSSASSQTKNLAIDDFVKTYKSTDKAVLLDVRTPGEWSQGKFESSKCINVMDQSFADQVSKLDKNTPLFVYCKVGGRSSRASSQLEKMGFKKVYNLTNAGYDDLAKKGLK